MIDPARLAFLEAQMRGLYQSASSYSGMCYRCIVPIYGNSRDAVSGEGSLRSAGRFHAQGAFRIVYTRCSVRTAEWEFFHTARTIGFRRDDLYPVTTLAITAHLHNVLKLTDNTVLHTLGITRQDLLQNSWQATGQESLTQALGRLAYSVGFAAVLTPSAGRGRNLNVMPDRLQAQDIFEIKNADRLPPPQP